MASMNRQKVIVGGVVAGIVLMVLDYVVWTYVLGPWAAGTAGAISGALADVMNSKRAMVGSLGVDLLFGISIVWCYAAIRPRYGAGAQTGMCAAAFVWFVSTLAYGSFYLDRLMSIELVCVAAVAALIEFLIAAYVGCRMYSEDGAAA